MISNWWLATSTTPQDNVLASWGQALGLRVFRGDEDDVLSRFVAIAETDPSDWIVRVTADDPFMDGRFISSVVETLEDIEPDVDMLTDGPEPQYPLGYAPQFVRTTALLQAAQEIPDSEPWHRTHAGASWLIAKGRARPLPGHGGEPTSHWRLTIDTPDDLRAARELFDALGDEWQQASYPELVKIFAERPEIQKINSGTRQRSAMEG